MKHSHTRPFLSVPNISLNTKDSLSSRVLKRRLIDPMWCTLQCGWLKNVAKFRCYNVSYLMRSDHCNKYWPKRCWFLWLRVYNTLQYHIWFPNLNLFLSVSLWFFFFAAFVQNGVPRVIHLGELEILTSSKSSTHYLKEPIPNEEHLQCSWFVLWSGSFLHFNVKLSIIVSCQIPPP